MMDRYVIPLIDAVLEAGRASLASWKKDIRAWKKKDGSEVTQADIVCHDILFKAITNNTSIPCISEEEESLHHKEYERFFLIDPIDGTNAFMKGEDDWTINVAFIDHGCPVLGILLAPVHGDLFVGMSGWGTRTCSLDITNSSLCAEDVLGGMDVIGLENSTQERLLLLSRSHTKEQVSLLQRRYSATSFKKHASAYKFCLLLKNQGSVYPRTMPSMEWDIAAGHALLLNSGGDIFNLEGETLQYGHGVKKRFCPPFIASNLSFLETLR